MRIESISDEERQQYDKFDKIVFEARGCILCPRMVERKAVLSRANGVLRPRVLFVAEAPGRKGGDRTGVPMHGDVSGRHFSWLLASIALPREAIFITNAVLCNPRKTSGANDRPTLAEIANCAPFLIHQLDLLLPELVVSVGVTALHALDRLESHGLKLAAAVGRCVEWRGTRLIPVYHPSPQVTISHRSLEQQAADWQAIRAALDTQPDLPARPARSEESEGRNTDIRL